jgi:catechol 2,3-dioxygenase-like lactoylglutathione lyase family enzyme
MIHAVIAGAHTIVFAEDAEAARAFFRDVIGWPSVDAGDGWLIFELPPGELAVHPGPGWSGQVGQHELFLMCHDIDATVAELQGAWCRRDGPLRAASPEPAERLLELDRPGVAGVKKRLEVALALLLRLA